MKNKTFTLKRGLLAFATLLLGFQSANAQIEYYLSPQFATRFNDVNDNGTGVSSGQYFDWTTQTWSPIEAEAAELVSINNNGDVAGSMFLDEEAFIFQPAFKKNNVWTPIGWFPQSIPAESSYSVFSISPNGVWVTGQMSIGCCEFGTFKYNTETNELTAIFEEGYEAIAGYVITNDGTIGGWVDDGQSSSGTLRMPAYITPELEIILVGALPAFNVNAVNDINDSFTMVGDHDGAPFIYDLNTDVFTSFDVPLGYFSAVFTSISNNGVAVGFAQYLGQGGNPVRDAIIYHPDLGSQPLFIKDILQNQAGIAIGTDDGLLGTAIAISPDGNYVCGWVNMAPFFAPGWMVHFDDLLLVPPVCEIICPANIAVVDENNQGGTNVEYAISFECGPDAPAGVNAVLISGPASGSFFPLGITPVLYHLVDGEGNFISACSFNVTVSDAYCAPSFSFIEAITHVDFAGIENTTSADFGVPANEYFFDITGNVNQGASYPIALEGYTGGGPFINFFTVFIDFNQDNIFDTDDEMFEIGSIEGSTGSDGMQATGTIEIPADAPVGLTRLRVVKNYEVSPTNPCGVFDFGQSEDYMLMINEVLSVGEVEFADLTAYPNPATDVLNVRSHSHMASVSIFNVNGQLVHQQVLNSSVGSVDMSSLAKGVYSVNISNDKATKTIKVIKL